MFGSRTMIISDPSGVYAQECQGASLHTMQSAAWCRIVCVGHVWRLLDGPWRARAHRHGLLRRRGEVDGCRQLDFWCRLCACMRMCACSVCVPNKSSPWSKQNPPPPRAAGALQAESCVHASVHGTFHASPKSLPLQAVVGSLLSAALWFHPYLATLDGSPISRSSWACVKPSEWPFPPLSGTLRVYIA